jgi:outer membrane protein TolC
MKIHKIIFIIWLSFFSIILFAEITEPIEQFPKLKLDPKKNQIELNPSELIRQNIDLIDKQNKKIARDQEINVSSIFDLSLNDIRKKALQNNLDIKIAQFDPKISNDNLNREKAKFDQTLYVYANYKENKLPSIADDYFMIKSSSQDLNDQEVKLNQLSQEQQNISLDMGIKIPLQTGGQMTISSPLVRKKSYGEFSSDEYQNALRFSFTQPLLRNYGSDVNTTSIKLAENKNSINLQRLKLQSIRIISIVDKAYWELKQAWSILNVRKQQYELAEKNLTMVKKKYDEGLLAKIELTRAEIGIADQIEKLIYAETQLKISNRQLFYFINNLNNDDEQKSAMIYSPISEPSLIEFNINKNELYAKALKNRIELIEQEIQITNKELEADYFNNQTLPLFSLQYEYGALSNTYSNFNKAYSGTLGDSYNDWMLGIKFEVPFSNEARKSRLSQAINEKNKTLQTYELKKLTVKKEIYDAVDVLNQNWQRIKTSRQQVLIAGINYDAELKQFEEGFRTMTEVLEALNRLGDVQIKEIQATIDYQVSLIDLSFATGSLLGYSNTEI